MSLKEPSLMSLPLDKEKEKHFFLQKNFQNGRLKKLRFSKVPILNMFSRKLQGLVLGLVELINVKGIDVAQPIWS